MVIVALAMGALAAGRLPIPYLSSLPPAALVAVFLLIAALPILVAQWWASLVILVGWFMFEDLIRKLAGNNLGVYMVKDLIYVILLIGLAFDPRARRVFSRVTGRASIALFVLITWAVVMSVPSLLVDWRLPLLGLRLDFFYVPLVIVGAIVARDRTLVYRLLLWIAILSAIAAGLGIVQAIIGPSFLAPSTVTPGLDNLVTVKKTFGGLEVYRPSGPFVDPGRFGAAVIVGMASGLAAIQLKRKLAKVPGLIAVAVCAAGVWISGGRSPLIVGIILVTVAALGPTWTERRPSLTRIIPVAAVVVLVMVFLTFLVPQLLRSSSDYYQTTLDPRSPHNEWSSRWATYTGAVFDGIRVGGILGRGTGQESLGKQYLLGGSESSSAGLYSVESGYGSLAAEWGIVGLGLWIWWMVAWLGRGWSSVRASRGDPLGATSLVLFSWMFLLLVFQFYAGIPVFQNYFTNAYLWLFSGIVFALPEMLESARRSAMSPGSAEPARAAD